MVTALKPASEFPIDMLRYDNCVPASERDASAIARLGYGYDRGWSGDHTEVIALIRYARVDDNEPVTEETGALHANSYARWRTKFHWDVVSDKLDERDV